MKDYKGITTFDELIENEHGKIGTENRNEYEEKSQMFIVSEMLKEARKQNSPKNNQQKKQEQKRVISRELKMQKEIFNFLH